MNKQHILFHLGEAKDELDRTIRELNQTPEYDYGEYVIAMAHLYHHLNTAWNGRDASPERAKACSEEDFRNWRQFPQDIDMSA